MNRMIRGMAGLMVALGASACADDPSVEFGGDTPTKIQVTPTVMFVTQGVREELLVRLVDDRNRSTATSFDITNVSAGLTVELDTEYRPDYVGSDELEFNPIQHQHRFYVTGVSAVEGSFTVSSSGISQVVTVRVIPTTLGASLSSGSPAVGEVVTITAPPNLSFTAASTVSFSPGGEAVITDQQANSISFIPIPGSSGVATVTGIILDYAPTLDPRSLTTGNELEVAAVTAIPLVFSSTAPLTPVTVTAAGFRFEPGLSISFGGRLAYIVSVAGDGTSASVVLPAGVTATPEVGGVHLSFLPSVSLSGLSGPTEITTPTTAWNGENPDGSAPVIVAAAPGTEVIFWDSWLHGGADIIGGGGPLQWYNISVATPGVRVVTLDWSGGADIDVYSTDAGVSAFVGGFGGGTSAHPETFSPNYTDPAYWIVAVLFAGDTPGVLRLSIK